MTIQLACDLIGRFACPTLDDHLGVNLPIGWRMMASGQFAYLALLLFILRCSCLYALGHGSAPSSVTFSSHMVSPLRNGALDDETRYCDQCGAPVRPGKRFCIRCGARLP